MRFNQITKVMAKSLGVLPDVLLKCFRPAQAEDIKSIVEFRKKNLGGIIQWNDEEYLTWRYAFENESQQANARNRVWLVKREDNIVGIVGAQYMPVNVSGKILNGLHPMDLLVDKSIDGAGLGAWMQLALNEHCEVMVIIGANENSKSIARRIFHSMPNRQVWKQILDVQPVLEKYLKTGVFSKALSYVINPFVSLHRFLRSRDVSKIPLEMRQMKGFTEGCDLISSSQSRNFVFGRKSSSFLNWKFFQNPNLTYELYGFFDKNICLGYIVANRIAYSNNNSRGVQLQDFFWLEDTNLSDKLLKAIVAKATKYFKSQSIQFVDVHSYGNKCAEVFSELGFVKREGELVFSVSCNISEHQQAIYDSQNWFITDADGHSGLA